MKLSEGQRSEAWSQWVKESVNPNVFATFTVQGPGGMPPGLQKFRSMVSSWEQIVCHDLADIMDGYFWATERGKVNDRLHLHVVALMDTTKSLWKHRLERSWRHGYSQVRELSSDGGIRYVTKYVTKGLDETLDFNMRKSEDFQWQLFQLGEEQSP